MSEGSDSIRERILQAAGSVFAERGFESATVREICGRVGANVAAVNYYFGDKQQLYVEAVRRAHEARVEKIPVPLRPPGTPAEVLLYDFIRTLLERMLGDDSAPWQVKLVVREVCQPTEACRELVEQRFRPRFERLQEILDNFFPADLPAHRRRLVALSVIGQCVHYRMTGEVIAMLTPEEERRRYHALDQLAFHISTLTLASLQDRPIWDLDTDLGELLEELAEVTSS
jgi:AcrR family transcriptional regulator